LKVGRSSLNLRFWREDDGSRWEVLEAAGEIEVVEAPWEPWPAKPTQQEGP
jgi:hypothetical protein